MVYQLDAAARRGYEETIDRIGEDLGRIPYNLPLITDQLINISNSLDRIEANLDRSHQLYNERVEWINAQEEKIKGFFDEILKIFKSITGTLWNTAKIPLKVGDYCFHQIKKTWRKL